MATTSQDVLVTWRELERQLARLVTDDERIEDIRAQIAQLRTLYRQVVDSARDTYVALDVNQERLERAREIVRRHFPPGG